MKKQRYSTLVALFLALFVMVPGASGDTSTVPVVAQAAVDPQEAVEQAWARVREAGSYRFLSTADQTLVPRPIPEMIGQGDMHLTIENDGAVMLPDHAYVEMRVAGSGREESVALLRDGSQAFMVQDGELEPTEDALSLATPGNDILGYLAAAEQVTLLPPPEERPDATRYGFQISGARFEEYVRRQAEADLAAEPGAPQGLKLQVMPALQAIRGQGELWVNQDGLPLRQVLDIEMPEASAQYGARVHMVVDIFAHGRVEALPRAVQDTGGAWRLKGELTVVGGRSAAASEDATTKTAAPSAANQTSRSVATEPDTPLPARLRSILPLRTAPMSAALFALAVLAIVAWRYFRRGAPRRNPRRGYALLAMILIPIMVLGPLLQSGQIVRFTERRAQAAEARAEGTPDLLRALGFDVEEPQATGQVAERAAAPFAGGSVTSVSPSLTNPPAPIAISQDILPRHVQAGDSTTALLRCGEGDLGVDTDVDGLPDPVELCLGTSPYKADSDSDGIPDKVELDGFDLDGKHWDSDPLNADSNGDGVLDTFEWASELAENGQAASADIDGDGVPNIWDDDDDGDGVPDDLDLSAQVRSDYTTSIDLSADGEASDGHIYLELQVQPQDPKHLRYSTTALDWPMDDEGNVQDLDLSTEDVRLTPFLLVETNVRPAADLEGKYGFSSWQTDEGYIVLVPLVPVVEGGTVYAFYGKVAYAPGQVIDLQWRAKMVWMTQMQQDVWVYQTMGNYNSYWLETETRLLHQYVETFRLTGLRLTLNEGYEAAVLGTPDDTDDLALFRVMLGLSDTFRAHLRLEGQEAGETALEEVAQRFADGSTASITHTFGVESYRVKVGGPIQYLHADAGMGRVGSELLPGFLERYDLYYGSPRCQDADGSPVTCATLLVAYEQSQGAYDLGDVPAAGSGLADLTRLHINVTDVPVVTTRAVQMRMYEQGVGGWQVATPARVLELVEQRYKSVYGSAMRDFYPELTIDDVRFMAYSAYLAAISPSYTPIAVDGQALVPDVADESALAANRAISEELEADVTSVIDWVGYGSGMAGSIVGVGGSLIWVGSDFLTLLDEWGPTKPGANAWGGLGVGLFAAATAASMVMGTINAVCSSGADLAMCRNTVALKAANIAVNSLAIVAQAQCVASLVISYAQHSLKAISGAALVAQAIGVAISIGMSWMSFTIAALGGDPVAWRVALAEAIVTTIYLLIVFAINFVPIIGQIITAILSLIDMIIALFTGLFTDQTWSIAKAIVNLFYDASVSTALAAAEFGVFGTALTPTDGGLVGGSTFEISIPFSGVITKTSDGTNDDLDESHVEGVLVADPTSDYVSQDKSTERDCNIVNGELHCANTARLGYALRPHINGIVSFTSRILYRTVWAEYGMYHAWRWNTHTEDAALPDMEDAEWSRLALDVIPGDLDDLWGWDALGNPDRDGDGLSNAMEEVLGTDPDLPDTDGDGLSDHYEWMTYEEFGADPLLADTDGDGLNDGLERRIGTFADVADSDGDGLTDGEEVRRVEAGALVGGWTVNLSGYGAAWVTSSPLKADDDADDLNAYEERMHGLSPRAANALVPTLSMSVAPILGMPGGRSGLYLRPGETVTITLQVANVAAGPVDSTLTLYVPDWFEDIQGGVIAGDRTPTKAMISGSGIKGVSWAFTGANALQTYEFAATTVTARVATSVAGSTGQIRLTLPYTSMTLERAKLAVVDVLPPEVAVLAPVDGAFLRGTDYVVGGTARDATTWLTGVDLSIVPQGGSEDWQPLSGSLSPWAHTWTLPGDDVYALRARATDAMGNVQTTDLVSVTVDNTPPTTTLSSRMDGAIVRLSGTATDNLAGIERVQLSIDGQPWRSVTLDGQGTTNATWTYDWQVGVNAQGKHEVRMRALDRAGNASVTETQPIVVDRVAPSSVVNAGAEGAVPPSVKAGATFTLTGVADEGGHLPAPAAAADLRSGMDAFADASVWLGVSSIHDNDGGVLAAWIGDFDADRMADLAVGLPGPEGDAGQVAVLYGRAGGWPAAPGLEMLAESRTRFYGEAEARLGSHVAAAGDVNGDGMFDLLVGERESARAFLVFGYPGPLAGVTLDGGREGLRTLLHAPASVSGLAGAGDVNGDGRDDILVRAGATAYLILGRRGPWPEVVDVAAEAAAVFDDVTGATGVGDVNNDQRAEWVIMSAGRIALYGWDTAGSMAQLMSATTTADAEPRVAALGDVDGDGLGDWAYSNGADRTLVYASGATSHTFSGYDGLIAAPGDVDGDGRADILLADAAGVGSLIRQQEGEAPEVFATIAGVGGAANAPYAGGADLNADGSDEVVLIPSRAAAEARGFDAPDFSSGFVSPQALPLGVSSVSAMGGAQEDGGAGIMSAQEMGILSTGADTRYVDDDDGGCDGQALCYSSIQGAVDASDGGGDTIIVYPGVYGAFSVPAGANYDSLTVRGVNPDAVFVEGDADGGKPDAVTIAADGVRLVNLTVRDAVGGITLAEGAGEPTISGGSETIVDHVVAHTVQHPISMTRGSALSIHDSTLVGDGAHPILYVDPAPSSTVHAWNVDRGVGTPAVATMQPIAAHGALLSAGGNLYAVPGGTSAQVYASTPAAGGSLGAWSAPFTLKHDLWQDTPAAGTSMLAASGSALYQLHTNARWPKLGGTAPATGITYTISAVAVHPTTGDVYVGGAFTRIGDVGEVPGVTANHLARWDGTSWHKVGDPTDIDDNGVDGPVYALHFAPNSTGGYSLYIGGDFDHLNKRDENENQMPVGNVVSWTGSQWKLLGEPGLYSGQPQSGTNGPVYALTHDSSGRIYVGGSFTGAYDGIGGALPATNVAMYNQLASVGWTQLGGGLNGPVHALVATGGQSDYFYAGGTFTASGGTAMSHVARYSQNTNWQAMGAGFAGNVIDLAFDYTTGAVYVAVDSTEPVQRWDGSAWSAVPGVSSDGSRGPRALAIDPEGNVYAGGYGANGAALYVRRQGATGFVLVGYESVASMSANWIEALALDGSGRVYAATNHAQEYSIGGLSRWLISGLYMRAVSGGGWTTRAYPPTGDDWMAPTAMAGDGTGNLYAVWGSYGAGILHRFNAATNTWTQRANPPTNLHIKHLVWATDKLYALGQDSSEVWRFARFDDAANAWTTLAAPPLATGAAAAGLSWSWDGGDAIYLLTGDGTRTFRRYRIGANAWDVLPDPTPAFTVSHGPAMARVGDYLYVYGTPDAGVTTNLFRYGALPASDLRLTVRNTAFVAPDAATSFAWTSLLAATGNYSFMTSIDASNAWVGPASASWTPARPGGSASLTTAQADFVAATEGLYRVGADSALDAGYHRYVAVAHVYPSEAACTGCGGGGQAWGDTAFATVREAVESGAARVLVHPGRYPQTFYLVSGVAVLGSGAEVTIIEAPAGTEGMLVTAEGVAHATLARVTLAGTGGWQGFLAEGGTRDIIFTRNIVRDLSTGVRLRGGSEVAVVNNTIVRNDAGIVAEGANAVNVRNTIVAYNTGTGLQHGDSPASLSSTYNDFYGNGVDMSPEEPGGGTVFFDPAFRSLAGNDLRLRGDSLLIDRGSSSDPRPPGTGTRVDIGYAEYNAAGFYVSPRYSETGINDGLIWGVDAFGSITDGLGAAAAALAGLQGALPEGGYSVGVDAGTYTERVTVPSHVRLVGSGAEATTIDAGGADSAVTFDGVIDAEVSGMTLQNAGAGGAGVDIKNAASGITIARNIIGHNAGHGVRLAGSSSAAVDFCTLADNAGAGVHATDAGTWAEVRNSIVSGGDHGLQAASDGLIRNDYNLLNSETNLDGVAGGEHTLTGSPAFATSDHYYLTAESPALDAADPLATVPPAGGVRADLGYKELTASPLTLYFGPQIDTIVTGNSGVQQVEVGVVPVSDATQPVTATLPTTWQTLTMGTPKPLYFWNLALNQATSGLYRVYSRATDVAGNAEADEGDWYEGALVVDDTAPTIVWGTPALPASTSAAAVLAVAQVEGTVSTGTGTRGDVKQVYFRVVGPDRTITYPANGDRAWIPLPVTGSYSIQAFAVDEAGNQAQTSTATVTVSASGSVATISAPSEGSAVAGTEVALRGHVRFATAGTGTVRVAVSGGATVQATLEEPGARFSAWWATVSLPTGAGAKVVTITPSVGGVAGTDTTLNLTLDTTAPTLVVNGPAAGTTVTRTVTFEGTASDAGSGLARAEVSMDGGYTWRRAALDGDAWNLSVELSGSQDYVSYPARVRTTDAAGNVAMAECAFAVDSTPPTGMGPARFSELEGRHVPVGTTLSVEWNAPVDAGGPADVLLAVDQNPTTEPTSVEGGTNASAILGVTGDWYVHLAARDAVGNQVVNHHGPWHARDMANASFAERRQSIIVDGLIDLDHDEWVAGDLLGTDARGIETQQLYATWDGQAIYLGWSGAWWTLDGTMWAYLELIPGGGTQAVDAALTLPFAADVAVRIDGPESGELYTWTGSTWRLSTDEDALTFAHGSSGDTEARIVRSLTDDQSVRLVAFALAPDPASAGALLAATDDTMGAMATESGQPWAIFPNTNPLGGALYASYSWYSPLVNQMNDNQPTARTVEFSATSPQASGVAWCPGSTLSYAIALHNPEPTEITGLELIVEAIEGLGFQSVSGGTLMAGVVGGPRWEISVPTIAPGATRHIVVTALLADDLTNVSTVTTHIRLTADYISLTGVTPASITHHVDGRPPTATIDVAAGAVISSGAVTFTGTAGDDDGSGVAKVEVREAGAAEWTTASGATAWSTALGVPDDATTFALEARAVDACGHFSGIETQAFIVDHAAPEVSWTVPAAITSTMALLGGSTSDPDPADALVARVQVQLGSDDAVWLATRGPYPPVDGVQGWTWGWMAPQEDGVEHQLRARAIDGVGNATTTTWSSTIVDVVAPAITVTTALSSVSSEGGALEARLFDSSEPPDAGASAVDAGYDGPILAGTVSDGSGVGAVRIWVYGPSGNVFIDDAALTGEGWEYRPDLRDWEIGDYALRVQAIDIYGNAQVFGPHTLDLGDQPIEGLQAVSDSPKPLGETVTLTATISAGTHVTYTWDLGDGAVAGDRIVTHVYAAPGLYTTTVTATNTISQVSASVAVLIEAPVTGLVAGNDGPTPLGGETVFSATVEAGSNVIYAWAFGDGATGSGASVTHEYPAVGSYVAEVTAHNSVSSITATTTVVVAEPIAGLQAHASAPEAVGAAVALSATVSAGSTVAYAWDYGDGEAGSGETVAHAYAAPGVYTATVTATNDISQDDASVTVLIEVPASGLAASNGGPVILGAETTLSATVEAGSNVVYDWTFGDGETGSGAAVTHQYPAVGSYVAEVTAHNSISGITATTTVLVKEPGSDDEPIVGLQAHSSAPEAVGAGVAFSATISAGAHVLYAWDYGDGETGAGRETSHTYAAAGTYTATVTATNGSSQAEAAVGVLVEVPVHDLRAENDGPTPLGSETLLSATVEAGSNVIYDWAFGDGETGSGATATHQYPAVGSYVAEVTAHNSISSITATTSVVVAEPIAGLQAHTSAPEAVGVAVEFSATVSAGSTVIYAWDYGDGEAGSGQTVAHAYAAPGVYTTTVTATNGVSRAEASVALLIEAPVRGVHADNDGPTPLGGETVFSATVEAGSNVVYDWAFGDGETGSGASVSHRYPAAGHYTAEVTAHNSISGITATTTVVIESESEQPSPPRLIRLPAIYRSYAQGPDLVVTSIDVGADGIAVTVRNEGNAPVVDAFWIDLYVAPREAPTAVGQLWQDLGEWGMVWGITGEALPLAAGASLTLRGGDALYAARYSVMPEVLPAGTEVYAQVDSVASPGSYGAVLETDELAGGPSNNIAGPVTVSEDVVLRLEPIDGDTPRMSGRPEVQ